ncbi:MAG: AI-2E family transporter [Candidatus Paceibacterota bacterium]
MPDNHKNVNITITSGTIIKTLIFIMLLGVLFAIKDLILVVLVAIVIASAIEPFVRWLGRHHIHRIVAVILMYVILAAVFIAIFYFFVPSLLNDAASFIGSVPKYVDSLSAFDPFGKIGIANPGQIAQNLSEGLSQSQRIATSINSGSFIQDINNISSSLSSFSEGFTNTVGAIFGGLLSLILIIVLSFYFAVQENGIANFLKVVTPLQYEKYVVNLWRRAEDKIGKWMQGQLLLAVIIAVLVYLGLTILGVKNALFLAFLAGLFETIPLFGPILSAIPAIVSAYAGSGLTSALLVTGLYLIIHQFENQLIYPLVVKKIVGVPPILVILALIIGWQLGGFLGLILSVPAAATLMEFFDDLQSQKLTKTRTDADN